MKFYFTYLLAACIVGGAKAQDLNALSGLDLSKQLKSEYENSSLEAAGTYFFRKDIFESIVDSPLKNQAMSMRLRDLGVFADGAFVAEGGVEGFVDYHSIGAARDAGALSEYVIIADEELVIDLVDGLPSRQALARSISNSNDAFVGLDDLTSCHWVYTSVNDERRCHWVCSDSSIFARSLGLGN